MTLQEIFISNLKKHRKEQGLSQMSLSEICETTSNYIGQIEMGRRIPSFDKIEKIAVALNIHPSILFLPENDNNGENKEKTADIKKYLQKMPVQVKKELITQLLKTIKSDISDSLDARKY